MSGCVDCNASTHVVVLTLYASQRILHGALQAYQACQACTVARTCSKAVGLCSIFNMLELEWAGCGQVCGLNKAFVWACLVSGQT